MTRYPPDPNIPLIRERLGEATAHGFALAGHLAVHHPDTWALIEDMMREIGTPTNLRAFCEEIANGMPQVLPAHD